MNSRIHISIKLNLFFRFEAMKVMNQLCKFEKTRKVFKLFADEYAEKSMFQTMRSIDLDMNDTFAFCKLFDKWIDCDEIFFPVLTDTGICYSFNTMRLPEVLTNE